MISVGLAGKPNSGKSTFFRALTLVDVAIANYPFTTIKPNVGTGYVRTECICKSLGISCENCIRGNRFIPVEVIDIAGLVPDAHKGRGLGNEFLDNLRQAEVIIHVVDASGSTDPEGNVVKIGEYDPLEDVEFLEKELTMWIYGILKRNWDRLVRKLKLTGGNKARSIAEVLAGAGVSETIVREVLRNYGKDPVEFTDGDLHEFAEKIRDVRKLVISANKADMAPEKNVKKLLRARDHVIPTSGAYEYALRMAAKNGYINYLPGDNDFEVIRDMTEEQINALERIRDFIRKFGSTGVQQTINTAVFDVLGYIVVYPVEDENKYTDSKGNVLPDAILVKKGSHPRDLAAKVHSDLAKHFLYAVDAKTRMRISDDYELKHNDVIRIVSSA